MGQHMEQHGDGVKDVAFLVSDAKAIYEAAVKKGAKSVSEPKEYTDEGGKLVLASVQTVCEKYKWIMFVSMVIPFTHLFKEMDTKDSYQDSQNLLWKKIHLLTSRKKFSCEN